MGEPEDKWYRPQVSRQELKALMTRSDRAGLVNFSVWVLLLLISGYTAYRSWGTWWAVPAFFVYGTLYTSSDARWHECAHGTPFRTGWLNTFWYHLSSFMTLREGIMWRWSHSRHHTYTGVRGLDSEVQVPRPANLLLIVSDVLALSDGAVQLKIIAQHAFGIIAERVKDLVPPEERRKMILSCRIYIAAILGVVAWSIAIRSILPLMFVVLPRFYGGWHHLLCSLTQHAALAEDERDHRLNTRTVYMNPVSRFLYMNMNYHVEHHLFPMIPYHALPRLHAAVKEQLSPAYPGFVAVYRELIPALLRQSRDADYYVRRPLPVSPEEPG